MIEDQLELEEREREWYAERAREREMEAELERFRDTNEEVADQINYLSGGYFPRALRTITAQKCCEALTMQHIYQSFPNVKFLNEGVHFE